MDLLAPFVRRIVAPAWAAWEHSDYLRHYRRLLRTQYDPPEVIRCRQLKQIQKLVEHAHRTTPFWKLRLDAAGLVPGRVGSFDDLRRIPLLTKTDLRAHRDEMLSADYTNIFLHRNRTSGSTGVPVEVLSDDATRQFQRACTLRSDEWSGWRLGERVAAVWGNAAMEYGGKGWRGYLRNALLNRTTCLDSLKLDESSMEQFARAMRRRPPALVYGHAHSVHLLATYLRARGHTHIHPRGVISAAMVLHDWERRTIEEVFHCKVTNRYGCEEVSLIACECDRHAGLHINADAIYLEVLRADGTPAEPGEAGMIVVTDLVNLRHADDPLPDRRYGRAKQPYLPLRTAGCRCWRRSKGGWRTTY